MIGRRLVPFGVAALLLAGCAESPDVVEGPKAPVGGASSNTKPRASDDLTSALAQWKDFPADAEPRPLVILRNTSGGGFKTSEAKIAFMEGNWRAPAELPSTPEEFGGYPVIGAAEALDILRADQADGRTTGSALKIESIRLVTVPDAATDRGPRDLPAWQVDFDGGSLPWFVFAVAQPARYAPDRVDYGSFGNAVGEESDTELILRHGGSADVPGPCGADYRIETAESDNVVAYRVVRVERPEPEPSEEPVVCPAALYGRDTPMTLERPIGKRLLVSADSEHSAPTAVVDREELHDPAMG